jgi:hypothetical protein
LAHALGTIALMTSFGVTSPWEFTELALLFIKI